MSNEELKELPFSKEHIIARLEIMEEDGVREQTSINKHIENLNTSKINFCSENYLSKETKLLDYFKALGNRHRIKIIQMLKQGVLCSCELEYILNLSQPTISHHLKQLENAGIIKILKKGKWNKIELNETPIIYWIFNQIY